MRALLEPDMVMGVGAARKDGSSTAASKHRADGGQASASGYSGLLPLPGAVGADPRLHLRTFLRGGVFCLPPGILTRKLWGVAPAFESGCQARILA